MRLAETGVKIPTVPPRGQLRGRNLTNFMLQDQHRRGIHLGMVRRLKETGFISEQTAGYDLIPELINILEEDYSQVMPMYFWSTREGSLISKEACKCLNFKIVACFPRRPKVNRIDQDHVITKINALLFAYDGKASTYGIPVLAGVPLVSSLSQLVSSRRSAWFRLHGQTEDRTDAWCRLTIPDGKIIDNSDPARVIGPLTSKEIRRYVRSQAIPMPWTEAIEYLKILRRLNNQLRTSFFPVNNQWRTSFFPGTYQPFHLLLTD